MLTCCHVATGVRVGSVWGNVFLQEGRAAAATGSTSGVCRRSVVLVTTTAGMDVSHYG